MHTHIDTIIHSYTHRGGCSKMPTLRKIVSFFCVDCKRSTCLYPMQRLIINEATTATIEVNSIRSHL